MISLGCIAFLGWTLWVYTAGKRRAYRERDEDLRHPYQPPGTPQARALYTDRPFSRS